MTVSPPDAGPSQSNAPPKRALKRPGLGTLAAVAWIFVAAIVDLLPTLVHGTKLGSQDILASFGLGAIPGTAPHSPDSGDQIQALMPWATLSWKAIHAGHFPFWNPFSGFGMPLFGNFQSASLSLPMLISYLGPERFVYTIEILSKMLIAGTGVLWMGRRLGLGNLAAALAGTVFMLSGSFTGWLGWPMTGTTAWLGWAVGATVLVVRQPERRALHVAGLAVVLAFVVYGGHPETLVMVLMCVGIVGVAALIHVAAATRQVGAVIRSLVALVAGAVAGMALAAPLLLTGLQIVGQSARVNTLGYPLPSRAAVNLLFATYWGLPNQGTTYFGPAAYYETAIYVGAIALVLAGLALVVRRRDSTVIGLGVVCVVCVALIYSARVSRFLDKVPAVRNVQWTRSSIVLDFALAALAGFGLQALLDGAGQRLVKYTFAALAGALALVTAGLWVRHVRGTISGVDRHIQAHAFIWPSIAAAGLVVAAVVLLVSRGAARALIPSGVRLPGRALSAAVLLCAIEAAFLLTATPRLWASSKAFFPATPAETTLQRDVGSGRVGFAACPSISSLPSLGILTEANAVYGVAEADTRDPVLPKSYMSAYYSEVDETAPNNIRSTQFCPSMTTATVARHFGVSFVLAAAGSPAPPGDVLRDVISGEDLYQVPGSGLVTVEPDGSAPDSPNATVVADTSTDPAVIRTSVNAHTASTVYIHVTDSPGWSATIDGHPLHLQRWGQTMLSASVPAGNHSLSITYEPAAFKIGVLLAVIAAALLILAVILSELALRRPAGSAGRHFRRADH